MNYAQIRSLDISNGEGIGISLFVQGCQFHCKGCFNSETWDETKGKHFNSETKKILMDLLKRDYITRFSILGGEPLYVKNLETVEKLIDEIRVLFPNKTIWLYTGYTWEYIFSNKYDSPLENTMRQRIISMCDVVIDGEYIEELRDITLHWCGSSNQRVINVKETLRQNQIILWES